MGKETDFLEEKKDRAPNSFSLHMMTLKKG